MAENYCICRGCNSNFKPYNNRKNVAFCSHECQVAYFVAKRRATRQESLKSRSGPCPWCSGIFVPKSSNQAFCSDACREKTKYAQKRSQIVASKPKVACRVCGSAFVAKGIRSKYCSINCRHEARNQRTIAGRLANPGRHRQYQTDYRQRNNTAVRKHRLKNWYGMTIEEYEGMIAVQDNRCLICRVPMVKPCVDHVHDESGEVRGILCSSCNSGIGQFKDDPALLRAAADYIERHKNLQEVEASE